ncbi:MAG: FIVAR domain-containing protein [Olsenella sp.]
MSNVEKGTTPPVDSNDTDTKAKSASAESFQGEEKKTVDKKPFYKRKWFIALVIFVVLLVLASGSGNSGSSDSKSASSESSAATSTSSSTQQNDSSSTGASAGENAKPSVDKSKLQSSVDFVNSSSNDGYTEDSWNDVLDATEKGQSVLDDENATQSQVDSADKAITNAISALKEEFNPDNYDAPAYTDVARTPDDWKGKKVTFTGRVLQVVEGSKETDLRVATDGSYDDIIMVGFDPSILGGTHVLEDDNVTVYGTCVGLYTYKSALGASISIPGIYADQVEIN